jgi:hypothetical protein
MIMLGLSFVANLRSVVSLVFHSAPYRSLRSGAGSVFWVLIGEIFPPSSAPAA